jgi:hypothetical protein
VGVVVVVVAGMGVDTDCKCDCGDVASAASKSMLETEKYAI